MKTYSVIAAKDGDVYHDEVQANSQEVAEAKARRQVAAAWNMTDTLDQYIGEDDEEGFDAELDGFAVDPVPLALTEAELLVVQDAVSNSDLQPHHERIALLDKIGAMLNDKKGA